jgi:hypothetical protein
MFSPRLHRLSCTLRLCICQPARATPIRTVPFSATATSVPTSLPSASPNASSPPSQNNQALYDTILEAIERNVREVEAKLDAESRKFLTPEERLAMKKEVWKRRAELKKNPPPPPSPAGLPLSNVFWTVVKES